MVEANPEENKTVDNQQPTDTQGQENDLTWIANFDLDQLMANQADDAEADLNELKRFVQLVTRSKQCVTALGQAWDAR